MPSSITGILVSAARAGAGVLLEYFKRVEALEVFQKGPADFVSTADLRSEEAIRGVILAADRSARFQSEETDLARVNHGPRFIIDPLDGTSNFLHGIPHFAVTIAYADDSGIVAGLVLDPMRDELFWAERDKGAFLNQRRLRVSTTETLDATLIHTGVPHRGSDGHAAYLRGLARLMGQVAGIRRMGSAALDLAYVAAGRGGGFFERGLKPWDLAAGMLLVREAGGIVINQAGGDDVLERGDVLAATPALREPLLAALRGD